MLELVFPRNGLLSQDVVSAKFQAFEECARVPPFDGRSLIASVPCIGRINPRASLPVRISEAVTEDCRCEEVNLNSSRQETEVFANYGAN